MCVYHLGNEVIKSALRQIVLSLSLRYSFVTEVTSLIVVQENGFNEKLERLILQVHSSEEAIESLSVVSAEPSPPPTQTGRVGGTNDDRGGSSPILQLNKLLAATMLLLCSIQ